jgi:hypothetical protein
VNLSINVYPTYLLVTHEVDGRAYTLKYDNQGVTHEINGQLYRHRKTTLPWFQHTTEDFWTEMENLVKHGL